MKTDRRESTLLQTSTQQKLMMAKDRETLCVLWGYVEFVN
jgi:hypothetical protein